MPGWELLTGIIGAVVAAVSVVGGGMYKAMDYWGNRKKRRLDVVEQVEEIMGRLASGVNTKLSDSDKIVTDLRDLIALFVKAAEDTARVIQREYPAYAARLATLANRGRAMIPSTSEATEDRDG